MWDAHTVALLQIYQPAVTFALTLAGTVDTFDEAAFRRRLAAVLRVRPPQIELSVRAASVHVTVAVVTSTEQEAADAARALAPTAAAAGLRPAPTDV